MDTRSRSMNHDKYNSRCVCAICTCGGHHCPRRQPQRLKMECETTNDAFYQPHPVERHSRWKERPTPVQTSYDSDVMQSSYKRTFKGESNPNTSTNKMQNSQVVQPSKHIRRRIPFEGQSSYKSQFLPNSVIAQQRKRFEYQPNPDKFVGESEYKQIYQKQTVADQHTASSRTPFGTESVAQRGRRRVPFEGQSSYKAEFKLHDVIAQTVPRPKYQPNPARFEGESHYKATFQKIQMPSNVCPVTELPAIPREAPSNNGHTNFVSSRNAWE